MTPHGGMCWFSSAEGCLPQPTTGNREVLQELRADGGAAERAKLSAKAAHEGRPGQAGR